MLDDLFDLEEVGVTSARAESRKASPPAEHLPRQGRQAVATPQEAMAGADIMVEASRLVSPRCCSAPGVTRARSVSLRNDQRVEPSLTDVMDKVVVDDWEQAQAGASAP